MRFLKVIQPNTCGGCTLCCKVLGIVELKKMPNDWCTHASKGTGCKIYSTRPESCQSFTCLWLSQNMPAAMRPDKVHGVLSTTEDGSDMVLFEDPGWAGHARETFKPLIDTFIARKDKFVIIVAGVKREVVAHPELLKRIEITEEQPNLDMLTAVRTTIRLRPKEEK